jgi:hypothetical protein
VRKPKRKGRKVEIVIDRKILWNPKAGAKVAPAPVRVAVVPKTMPSNSTVALNKHATLAKRDLEVHEMSIITGEFLKLNGIFEPLKKDCTRIRNLLDDSVSVFQVSGYVFKLHRLVQSGKLEVTDKRAYMAAIRAHRKHWLTYQGDKYNEMRERVEANGRKPKFAVLASRGRDTKPRHKVVR